MAVRSANKDRVAAQKIVTEYPKATIEVWELDISSYDSITAFIKRVQGGLARLDTC